MQLKRSGNITLMTLPIGIIILLAILIAIVFMYAQISIQIYEVKSNLFYLAHSSIGQENFESMAYRDYNLNLNYIKDTLDELLKKNYLKYTDNRKGIVDIKCDDVRIIIPKIEVIKHTRNKYNSPILCIKVQILFNPLVSILGREIPIIIHDDIKISLLEFI